MSLARVISDWMKSSGEHNHVRTYLRVAIILGLIFVLTGAWASTAYAADNDPPPSPETAIEESVQPADQLTSLEQAGDSIETPSPDISSTSEDGASGENDASSGSENSIVTEEHNQGDSEAVEIATADLSIIASEETPEEQAADDVANSNDAEINAGDSEQSVAEAVASADDALTDESPDEGDQDSTADSAEAEFVEESIPIPDPYFYINGDKHSFLPEGGNCSGAANCQVSTTPIQDALNAVSGGLTPDDSTIYIEGGIYEEDFAIHGMQDLTLQGGVDDNPSFLSGAISMIDSLNIALREFIFAKAIQVSDSSDVSIIGTEGDDNLEVALEGTVENMSVEGGGGSDTITIHQNAESSDVYVEGGEGDDSLIVKTDADTSLSGHQVTT